MCQDKIWMKKTKWNRFWSIVSLETPAFMFSLLRLFDKLINGLKGPGYLNIHVLKVSYFWTKFSNSDHSDNRELPCFRWLQHVLLKLLSYTLLFNSTHVGEYTNVLLTHDDWVIPKNTEQKTPTQFINMSYCFLLIK